MKPYKQILLFLSVGAGSAIVNFCAFALAWRVLKMDYKLAATLAYVLSVVVHFTGNHYITFQHRESNMIKRLKKYSVLLLVNYLTTLITITICVSVIHLSPYLSMAIAIMVTVIIGYALSQKWVFRTLTN